jgi:hypothetical protein
MLRDYATKGTCIWPQPPPIKVRNQRQGLKKTERKAKASTPHLRAALEQQQQAEHDDAVFAVEDVVDAERAGYDRALARNVWPPHTGTYGRLIRPPATIDKVSSAGVPTRPAGYTGDGSRADSGIPPAASRQLLSLTAVGVESHPHRPAPTTPPSAPPPRPHRQHPHL